MTTESSIAELLFPEGMLEYFKVTNFTKETEHITFYLEEKKLIPEEFKAEKLISKGYYEPITIEDFPLRGNQVSLIVKRRRWTIESTNKIVSRNWELVAKGTRKTQEFASFLKEINR